MDNESTTQDNPVIIDHFMPASEIIAHLRVHGCQNITRELDISSSSQYPIANGGLGDIYLAKLRNGSQVAIKTMRLQIDPTSEGKKHLKHAARELHTWAKCEHPNVLKLLGLAVFRDQIGMVSPWMGNGSLPSYLSREPNTDRFPIVRAEATAGANGCRRNLIKQCVQISDGLAYLHQCGIVHGDIKGLNVLVSTQGVPVLADFGNAVRGDRTLLFATTTANASISHRWAAPELLQGSTTHTMESDIYALGMTILETVTGKVPYVKKSDVAIVLAVVVRRELPERPKDVALLNNEQGDVLWALLVSCWSYEPNSRPNATRVASTMREISSVYLEQVGPDSRNAKGTDTRPGRTKGETLVQGGSHILSPQPSPNTIEPLPPALAGKPPSALSNVVPWQGEHSLPHGPTPMGHPRTMRELVNGVVAPIPVLVRPSVAGPDQRQAGHQRSESLGLIKPGSGGKLDKSATIQVARTQPSTATSVTGSISQQAPHPRATAASAPTSSSAPSIPFPTISPRPYPERQSSRDEDVVLLAPPSFRFHPSLPSDTSTPGLGYRSKRKSFPRSRSFAGSLPLTKPNASTTPVPSDINDRVITSSGHKWIKGVHIGSGLLGSVYLGMDAVQGLLMVVKQIELPTDSSRGEEHESMIRTLRNEIEPLEQLQHENIVQYLDSSIDDRHLNIFLEYVPGGSIAALLRKYGAFEEPPVRNWVWQILQGLNYLHEQGIVHRNIKGSNVLVDNKGGVKISDFGISKKVEDGLLRGARMHRLLQGSVFWKAPEVIQRNLCTCKADIWSVGCLVVELLTGQHPWAGLTPMQVVFKLGSSAMPTIPLNITEEAEDFLKKTFEIDHTTRPTAADLLNDPWLVQAGVESLKTPLPPSIHISIHT